MSLTSASHRVTLPAGIVGAHNDFTLAVWVKPSAVTDWSRVLDFGTGTNNYLFLTPRAGTTGAVRFAIRTPSIPEQVINGTAPLPAGAWTHVAVTLSGNTGTLYVNGVVVGTNPAITLRPSSLGNTTQNYIGESQFIADPTFNGLVDELLLYNRALTPGEIASFASPPAAPAGLTATAGDGQVALAWSAVPGATGYRIKRATVSGGPYTDIGSTVAPSYSDASLNNGTTYFYIVTTARNVSESVNSAQISATPSYFAGWQQTWFTPAQLANASISGPDADANGDGVKNLLAYSFNISPWVSAANAMPTAQVTGGYLTMTFIRRKAPTDATYTVEVSGDLAAWNSGASFTTQTSVTSIDTSTERVTVRDNILPTGQRRFIRVKVGY